MLFGYAASRTVGAVRVGEFGFQNGPTINYEPTEPNESYLNITPHVLEDVKILGNTDGPFFNSDGLEPVIEGMFTESMEERFIVSNSDEVIFTGDRDTRLPNGQIVEPGDIVERGEDGELRIKKNDTRRR